MPTYNYKATTATTQTAHKWQTCAVKSLGCKITCTYK